MLNVIAGLRRRTTEAESEAEATTMGAVSGEVAAATTEPASAGPSTEASQPLTTESKLSSLISRRRPLNRRLQSRTAEP